MAQMLWATNSLGGFLANPKLDKYLHFSAQPLTRFRQFTSVKDALGKESGDTFNWLKVANVNDYGGSLSETGTMHQTYQTITKGTLTITEYGNSIPYTRKLLTLSEYEVKDMIRKGLLNDFRKVQDGLVEREFNSCVLRYVGSSTTTYALTTNGTATATNTSAFNKYHVKNMVDELVKRNVAPYDGDNFICVASLEAIRGILDDLESTKYYVQEGYRDLLAGEVGLYYNCRFIRDNFATRYVYSASARTATAISWTGAYSLPAYIFGGDTIIEAVAQPETILPKEQTDYGRSLGLAWYFIAGYKIEWDDEPNTRIIKWDSA